MSGVDRGCELDKPQPLWRQIHDYYDQQITSGQLAPGAPLPSTVELAKRFGVTVNTVQQGMGVLCRRGLIERTPKRGTFVSLKARSHTLGILFGRTVLTTPNDGAYLSLWGHLGTLARARGWEMRHYVPLASGDWRNLTSEISQDAGTGRLRALIYLAEISALDSWIRVQSDVPWIGMVPKIDYPRMIHEAVVYLRSVGASRLALLSPDEASHGDCVSTFVDALERSGMPTGMILGHANCEDGGIRVGGRLTEMSVRPDAIVVCNDNACRGLIASLLSANIVVPNKIRIVSHANTGIRIFPGLDITRYEVDPAALATCILDGLTQRLAGENPGVVVVRMRFVKGASA